jgi:hypothetical protein
LLAASPPPPHPPPPRLRAAACQRRRWTSSFCTWIRRCCAPLGKGCTVLARAQCIAALVAVVWRFVYALSYFAFCISSPSTAWHGVARFGCLLRSCERPCNYHARCGRACTRARGRFTVADGRQLSGVVVRWRRCICVRGAFICERRGSHGGACIATCGARGNRVYARRWLLRRSSKSTRVGRGRRGRRSCGWGGLNLVLRDRGVDWWLRKVW